MPRPVMGNYDGAVVSGFFIAPPTSAVLHTIARVQPDCVEEKGYTVSVKARGNYPQQSVVLVESASTGA